LASFIIIITHITQMSRYVN